MKLYSVYAIPKSKVDRENPPFVFVNEGFNWNGFWLNLIYPLKLRLWKESFLLLSIVIIALIANSYFNKAGLELYVILLIMFYCGNEASNWQIKALKEKGYNYSSVVNAEDYNDAVTKFYQQLNNNK